MANLPELKENFSAGALEVINFEEIRKSLELELANYKNLGVTDENYENAKNIRAHLNAAKKAFNDRRIELEKRYMEPFNVGKNQIAQLCKMIDEVSKSIDEGVKLIEEERRNAKRLEIENLYSILDEYNLYNIPLIQIWDDKWLNQSKSLATIEKEIKALLKKVSDDIETIKSFVEEPKKRNIVINIYLEKLDINYAIAESKRLDEMITRAEAQANEHECDSTSTSEDPIGSVSFTITGAKSKIMKVRDLIKELGLEMEII